MTSEEQIELCLKRLSMGKTSDVVNFSYADTLAYIERLKAENAELRKRLEKAVELPRIEQSPYNGMFNGQTINDDTLLYYIEDGHIKQECFNNKFPEQLQKRLAELKGEKE